MMLQIITSKELYYNTHVIENNLVTQFLNATNNNTIRPENWYKLQKAIIKNKFRKYDFITFCGVIACLSPRMNWNYNIQSAVYLIENYRDNTMSNLKNNCRQNTRNIVKAIDIWESCSANDIFHILKSNKIQNFFMNLVAPDCPDYVTLDYHMIKSVQLINKESLTDKQYKHIKNVIIDISKEFNITPCHFQAIIWEYQKNK